jgi:hypothetical protein
MGVNTPARKSALGIPLRCGHGQDLACDSGDRHRRIRFWRGERGEDRPCQVSCSAWISRHNSRHSAQMAASPACLPATGLLTVVARPETWPRCLPQKLHRRRWPSAGTGCTGHSGVSAGSPLAMTVSESSTHFWQMYTPGPATSLRVLRCSRPQNEHAKSWRSRPRLLQRRAPPAASTIWWIRWWLSCRAWASSRSDAPLRWRRRTAR